MNHVDLKYASILSSRLDMFKIKQTSPYRANFRCPICGDSQKSKLKARGWILEKDNSAIFYCHNCGASHNLQNLLKVIDFNLFNNYVVDTLAQKYGAKTSDKRTYDPKAKPLDKLMHKRPSFSKKGSPLKSITKVSSLPHDHKCRKYVESRKIPKNQQWRLYYAPKFNSWVNSIIPNKLPELANDSPRLIMPFINKRGEFFGFNARAFNSYELRYITIMLNENEFKLFGLDVVDTSKKYYVIEGPLDSLFISNGIAMAGADGSAKGLPNPENAVFVFDNEPRNKEIVSRMEKSIISGFKVCIWPDRIIDKDINDMILSGMTSYEVIDIINSNTYEGLEGNLKLGFWRKC